MAKEYDLIVVGAGPAGLMAAKTAGENGLNVALIERKERITDINRACAMMLVSLGGKYLGERILLNPREKRLCFPRCGFSIPYQGPHQDFYTWSIYSHNGHKIQLGDYQENFQKGEAGRATAVYNKEILLKGLLQEALSHQVDVFHCQDLNTLVPGLVASRLLNKPVVFDAKDPYPEMISIVHSAAFVKFTNFVERFLCRHVDTIRTVNQLMRQRFEKITSKPIHIVHNYPELKDFNPEKYQGKEADQTLVFGRIGQIREGMGIEETVEAIKHILKKVRVQLLFVGRIKDSYRYRFMELIDPIRNNVEYVNEVPYSNIPDYYYRMDVFMLLYNMKGIASYISPTKLFDSMAMGVPVIASDVGETRDFVEKYKCGLVIKSNEKELILNAMETMIFNPDLRITFGQNGLRAAKTTTNWEKEKIKFVKVFNDCIRAS